jgi:cupin 2 domain-containing protein
MKTPSGTVRTGNLFRGIDSSERSEKIEVLESARGARIERIVSRDHASADGFWFDQHEDEWVIVLEGEAELEIEVEPSTRRLRKGDWIFLPAHCRHRVVSTAPDRPTIWLAVHLDT